MGCRTDQFENLEQRRLLSAAIQVQNGTLTIYGTPQADQIIVNSMQGNHRTESVSLFVTINGRTRTVPLANVRRIRIEAGAGDDLVQAGRPSSGIGAPPLTPLPLLQLLPTTILGGDGDDILVGGRGSDSIAGGSGRDQIYGSEGDDTLNGDGNSDTIVGNEGSDLLRGGAGDDRFAMDENDTVDGGYGTDFFSRQSTDGIVALDPTASPNITRMEGIFDPDDASEIKDQDALDGIQPARGYTIN